MIPIETQTYASAIPSAASVWLRRISIGLLTLLTGVDVWFIGWLVYSTALGESAVGTAGGSFVFGIATVFIGIFWIIAVGLSKKAWSKPCLSLLCVCWLTVLGAVFLMPITYWPMRLSFARQRPEFEQLAQQIERGNIPTKPIRLGFYTVTLAERNSNGVVCLWICPDEDARCFGFGRCKAAEVPRSFFNLNLHIALDDNWQFVEQD